ncbi:MAG: hypothetical protein Fur0040_11400 [Sideroxydans sp.]
MNHIAIHPLSCRAGRYATTMRALHVCALVMLIGWQVPVHAAELGRLFYTPQQRAELERQAALGANREDAPLNYLEVNGVIQKQGGNRIVWLNGKAQTPTRGVRNPASIEVAVPGKPKRIEVKVGQKLILRETAPPNAASASPPVTPKPEPDEE